MSRAHSYSHSRAHSPTFSSLHLYQNSFSNPSVTLPTSQLILQPFCHFTYITAHSRTLPLLHLHHSSFSNPSFASPTSQALHLIHLASRPCLAWKYTTYKFGLVYHLIFSFSLNVNEPKYVINSQTFMFIFYISWFTLHTPTFALATTGRPSNHRLLTTEYLTVNFWTIRECWKFCFQKKAIFSLDVELKEENYILDQDLNQGL